MKVSITWDGNTEGLTAFEDFGLPMYLVSDKLIPPGEVTVTLSNGKTLPTMTTEAFGIVMLPELMAFSAEAGEYSADGMSLVIPETGTYFLKADGVDYATSISWETAEPEEPTETISTAKKFLLRQIFPDIIARALIGGGGSDNPVQGALLSSDGYTLTDANGLYLIPKEG